MFNTTCKSKFSTDSHLVSQSGVNRAASVMTHSRISGQNERMTKFAKEAHKTLQNFAPKGTKDKRNSQTPHAFETARLDIK